MVPETFTAVSNMPVTRRTGWRRLKRISFAPTG
jgi:hypothetical protein